MHIYINKTVVRPKLMLPRLAPWSRRENQRRRRCPLRIVPRLDPRLRLCTPRHQQSHPAKPPIPGAFDRHAGSWSLFRRMRRCNARAPQFLEQVRGHGTAHCVSFHLWMIETASWKRQVRWIDPSSRASAWRSHFILDARQPKSGVSPPSQNGAPRPATASVANLGIEG